MSDLLPGTRSDEAASDSTTEVVQLAGDYDIATAADLRHALTDDTSAPVVVADFRDVTFVDSSALRALLEVRQHLEDDARTLELVNLPDQLSTLLRITDTRRLFHVA